MAVTEQIYVHSKLMIVGDRYVLVGSANINDRSLQGDRDSELAVLISDTAHGYTDLDGSGTPTPTRNFARELRQNAWRKWLGSVAGECAEALDKPALKAGWEKIQLLAKENAKIYEKMFSFIPRDKFKSEQSDNTGYRGDGDTESETNDAKLQASIWPVKPVNTAVAVSDDKDMPFSEIFWQDCKYPDDGSLRAVKGYFTALPVHWVEGENNLIPYNIRLIASNAMLQDDAQQLADNRTETDTKGDWS